MLDKIAQLMTNMLHFQVPRRLEEGTHCRLALPYHVLISLEYDRLMLSKTKYKRVHRAAELRLLSPPMETIFGSLEGVSSSKEGF